jgi:hypothetical protein
MIHAHRTLHFVLPVPFSGNRSDAYGTAVIFSSAPPSRMSFDFLSIFTGGGPASPPPPLKMPTKAPPPVPALNKEQAALAKLRNHHASLEKQLHGHQNQAERARSEARTVAKTNRAQALRLMDDAAREDALSESLASKVRDARSTLAQLERTMGLVAHAEATRAAKDAVLGLHAQIDVDDFEDTRDALHETANELNELDRMIDTPIGMSDENTRMTATQRSTSLSQALDDLLNADAMSTLDTVKMGDTRAQPPPTVAATYVPISAANATTTTTTNNTTTTPIPIPTTDSRSVIAKRLAAARTAARPLEGNY